MEISHIREFVYLAETLSFKQTADYFYVSRSVISRHVAGIEDALGAKLLDRSAHSVRLTEIGETLLRDARIVLRDYETALEHVRVAQTANARIVRIGYLRNAARPFIVQFVRLMKKRYQDIQLSLECMEFNELRNAIDDGTVDVALAIDVAPEISRNYRSTPIYTDRFYAIMSKEHPLAKYAEGIHVSQLPPDKLLLPDSFVYSGHVEVPESIEDFKPQMPAIEPFYDIDTIYLKVQTEDYVVFSSSANSSVFGSDLVSIPVVDIDSTFSVSAFYRNGLDDGILEACHDTLEECRKALKKER